MPVIPALRGLTQEEQFKASLSHTARPLFQKQNERKREERIAHSQAPAQKTSSLGRRSSRCLSSPRWCDSQPRLEPELFTEAKYKHAAELNWESRKGKAGLLRHHCGLCGGHFMKSTLLLMGHAFRNPFPATSTSLQSYIYHHCFVFLSKDSLCKVA